MEIIKRVAEKSGTSKLDVVAKVIFSLWAKELYPTVKTVAFIVNTMTMEEFYLQLAYIGDQGLFSCFLFEETKERSRYFSYVPLKRYLGNEHCCPQRVLSMEEKLWLKSYLLYVQEDTEYITPHGITRANYNKDKATYLASIMGKSPITQHASDICDYHEKGLLLINC